MRPDGVKTGLPKTKRESLVSLKQKTEINLPSLSRQRLGDQVADVLRQQILLGQLSPGKNIPERETAAALGVSRTPLREGLLLLEAEGLVEMSPSKSPVVANPSFVEVSHLLLVQSALEGLAGECACEEAGQDEIDAIEAKHELMLSKAEEPYEISFFQIDMSFHEAIVAATKNPSLIKTHRQYHSRLWRVRFLSARRRPSRKRAMIDHGRIVEGLRRRDKEQVSAEMRDHLRRAIDNIRIVFSQEDDAEVSGD
jgi:DNA-binding GntR family transcriptional regulator